MGWLIEQQSQHIMVLKKGGEQLGSPAKLPWLNDFNVNQWNSPSKYTPENTACVCIIKDAPINGAIPEAGDTFSNAMSSSINSFNFEGVRFEVIRVESGLKTQSSILKGKTISIGLSEDQLFNPRPKRTHVFSEP